MKIADNFTRTEYGQLIAKSDAAKSLMQNAIMLCATAVDAARIADEFDTIEFDRKHRASGSAVHHDIYDIAADGKSALVCVRSVEGSKYGVRTTAKDYFLITAAAAITVNKARAAKFAKMMVDVGEATEFFGRSAA